MQVFDSFIEGPMQLGNRRESDELIGMIVRFLYSGEEPEPRTDAQRALLTAVRPVMEKSRLRQMVGSKGGSKTTSKAEANQQANAKQNGKQTAKQNGSKTTSKDVSKDQSYQDSTSSSSSSSTYKGLENDKKDLAGLQEEDPDLPYAEIVSALNEATGSHYRPGAVSTRRHIAARFSEGYTLEDFLAVIAFKSHEWLDEKPEYAQYLRPETLFGPKFGGYAIAARASERKRGKFSDLYVEPTVVQPLGWEGDESNGD